VEACLVKSPTKQVSRRLVSTFVPDIYVDYLYIVWFYKVRTGPYLTRLVLI